jgi:hypothetical protein
VRDYKESTYAGEKPIVSFYEGMDPSERPQFDGEWNTASPLTLQYAKSET